ncbi:MAG: hypothetical protein MN733_09965 [Nitrososphaera sp.]|nr:hypothetical protein [Nitrososphaera sp.]
MDNIQINGVAVTDANFNDTTPSSGAGLVLFEWQRSGSGPDSVSLQTPSSIPVVLDREVADLTVVNTAVETSVFSHSVPANSMGTNRALNLVLIGDVLQNNTGENLTLRIKFGGTTIWQDASNAFAADADRRGFFLEIWLANRGATNSQIGGGVVSPQATAIVTAPTTGIAGDLGDAGMDGSPMTFAASSIDTTAAATLDVTIQWTTAGASREFRRRFAVLQLV